MRKVISRPEILLLLLIVPVILWAVLIGDAFDIHLVDTYFVIGPYFLTCWLTALLTLEAFIYYLTNRFRQLKVLQRIHVYGLAFFIAVVYFLLASRGSGELGRYYDYGSVEDAYGSFNDRLTSILVLAGMLAFFTGHVAFIVNLLAGFIKGKKATL